MLTDASIEGKIDRLLGLKENVIIGKLIPAATGLKRYRTIEIGPTEPVTREPFQRDELLQALEEIGQDGGTLAVRRPHLRRRARRDESSHEAGEAEEIPEVDSPLDD